MRVVSVEKGKGAEVSTDQPGNASPLSRHKFLLLQSKMTDQQYAHVDRSNLARGPGFGPVTCREGK